ncbi:rho GTPase-activating protein 7 [Coccinella septempunctata]|uniref:rho GTPase-activating protein 7 n=1 Tax=Coccinella septempunctata TaxID=41139 RepID=UPI001D062469|nr:rho GTPase-activating protein 7 [Coccinella septempunctata]XP_044765830.1 rho GTPase-activating protein 7 [Coccinella septempunctata]
MSLNDQYEELALYLAKAQNDISQALENQYATQLATHKLDEVKKIPTNERIFRPLKNGVNPKPDNNGHKVHFADAYEEIYIEPNVIVRDGGSTPYPTQKDRLKNNEQCLKSCLKKPFKESQQNKITSGFFDNSNISMRNNSSFPRNMIPQQNNNRAIPKITLSGSYPCLASPETNILYAPDLPLSGNYLSPQNVIPSMRRWSPSPAFFQEEKPRSYQDTALFYTDNSASFQEATSICSKENRPLCYEDLNSVFYKEPKESKPILYQETGIQCDNLPNEIYHSTDAHNANEADENLLALIASIKADIQELKQRYENDDEIERNRFLTKELDEILQMYKMNMSMERENDMISEIGSTSSYQSESLANVAHNAVTQTSPPLSISSTNLSKGSDCSSSPCLTSVSDTELADDESISSNEIKYQKPSIDWMVHSTPQAVLRSKSSSAPVLKNNQPKVNKQTRSQSDRHLAEIEAAEACKWLRATGFPQYAQMYEDMQFPVDISTAAQDHPRLEPDILNSLFRRLQILNNCVHLHQQRVAHNTDESEDENYALSKNWTFQSDIRRWSRACINEPTVQSDSTKTKKTSDSDGACDDQNGSPRERLRRGGSVKCRRRREGVIISENGAKLLDSLSEQLSGISVASSLNHASDSELTPKFYNRIWRKPSEDEFQHNVSSDSRTECQIPSAKEEESNIIYCKFSSHQLGQLEKIAMLKLTAYIEKYCPTHRTGWNWEVPKNLLRRMKNPAYKDKVVFGVPIQLTLQRTGHPLPRNIENALEWLQQNAADQVGLFRKSGVKSRIQALRNTVESSNEILSFEDQQSYDVADMVKQYFRELPEALLTNKLSETFKLIFQYVPVEHRLDAVLCGIFLMPDEHIEVLQTLVSFLIVIAKHSKENQMNESNLATCFAPSLFHYSSISKSNLGTPQAKDLAENKAAHDCLLFFLENHEKLFTIPKGLINQCNPAEMKEWKVLNLKELGKAMGGWKEYLKECEQAYLRELKEKSRGWTLLPNLNNTKVEIFFKKIDDGLSVRVWKVVADIDAPPSEVMHRILRERHIWDLELVSTKIVVQLDRNTEIFQYGRKRMTPLPVEEYCVVRHWKTDLPKGSCLIVETSVEHEDIIHIPDCIRGIVHASRFYIEPCGSGRSRLHHMCRTDTMGRKPEYYYKNYGHIIGFFISNIQSSFCHRTIGPESKV